MRQTISGPNGISVVLDSAEIIPSDPGAGTPAMVYAGKHSATFWCALDTGELDCGERQLTDAQVEWLDSVAKQVDTFLDTHSR